MNISPAPQCRPLRTPQRQQTTPSRGAGGAAPPAATPGATNTSTTLREFLKPSEVSQCPKKAPTRACALLKEPNTSTLATKYLLRHYVKKAHFSAQGL